MNIGNDGERGTVTDRLSSPTAKLVEAIDAKKILCPRHTLAQYRTFHSSVVPDASIAHHELAQYRTSHSRILEQYRSSMPVPGVA
eukprot:1531943-Rhodomonas_salina.2